MPRRGFGVLDWSRRQLPTCWLGQRSKTTSLQSFSHSIGFPVHVKADFTLLLRTDKAVNGIVASYLKEVVVPCNPSRSPLLTVCRITKKTGCLVSHWTLGRLGHWRSLGEAKGPLVYYYNVWYTVCVLWVVFIGLICYLLCKALWFDSAK